KSCNAGGTCTITGDPSQAILTIGLNLDGLGGSTSGTYIFDYSINITAFSADGTINGSLSYFDGFQGFGVGGADTSWSGHFNSDHYNCAPPPGSGTGACQVNGYWERVDEPFSAAMLGTALLALAILAWLRKRIHGAL